ncbi:hypothetical protein GF1_17610 [Desulfolithobacter dissulfuricans]|uniref:histidine kinase n=1 Tax=Desulfolithobacter dissulfuricans TaxID=2795293 RepID=A0A915XIP0_9BACT|nr:PAS domain S-box protein [Desulfolithobacter dissulfuricans]BCO09385.1 hypothetical protein GF1_17610 [Desulfolithobacter dissulfuricans]
MTQLQGTIAISFARPADERLVRDHLTSFDHRVIRLDEAVLEGPDLVLLDAPSATRCGRSFLLGLKQADPVFLPIIVALDHRGSAADWLNSGVVDDCLRLPLSKAELVSRINVFLRLRHQTAALAEKSEEIRALVESSEDHIFMLSEKGEFIATNNRLSHLGSPGSDDLMGRPLEDVFPADIARSLRRECARGLAQNRVRTLEYSLPGDHGPVHRHVTLFPVQLADGRKRVGGICRDITTLVQTEQDRFLLSKAMEFAAESVIITDRDRKIIFVNAGFEKISGYSRDEAMGHTPRFLRSGRHDESFYRSLHETIYSGRTWKGDLVNRNRNGSIYVVEATISPVFDEHGEITHFVSVRREVTEERQFEKVRQRVQRLEAIGTLAGGIAHDFNNILTPIMGYTELCKTAVPPDSQLAEYLDQVLLAANRSKNLVRQILSFSRQAKQEKSPLDIRLVIKEALKLIRAALPADIHIEQQIGSGRECVLADPTEIHQVIMNLCTNAQHAMAGTGGILSVSLRPVEVDEEFAASHPGLRPGPYLVLRVGDTGCGIPEEIQDRIFEPYFTTKEEDRGTGLGLATVHGIVTGSGGVISVESEPGKGTVFELYFPVVRAESADRAHRELSQVPGGRERILFVDDEPMIADLGRQMLERLGYTVWATTDPGAALYQLRQDPDGFDLVITDMTMPGMSGEQLVEELHKIRPDIPIIICTGYSDKLSAYRDGKNGVNQLLMKPIGVQDLARAVRKALEGRKE